MRYAIHTLDMWGHVPADCISHGCPCVTQHDTEEDSLGESAAVEARKATATHNDDACQCSEECNEQFRRGTLTVPRNASDAAILRALEGEGFSFPAGTKVDDASDGPLDVNDAEGRRLLHLDPIEPMQFRIPLVWRRTRHYHERIRPHVHQDGRLETYGDGGYPLFYVVQHGFGKGPFSTDIRCPKCATDLHDDVSSGEHAQVTAVDVNWEDASLFCDCGERIESAYAEPETPNQESEA